MKKGTLYDYPYEALAYKKIGKNMEPYIIERLLKKKTSFLMRVRNSCMFPKGHKSLFMTTKNT